MFKNAASEFVYIRTYSRWIEEEKRRENWPETAERYITFIVKHHGDKIPPKVIKKIRQHLLSFGVMPSMRAMWAAGAAAEQDNTTIYNCAFSKITEPLDFAENLYILMCGTGFGFSVRQVDVSNLPLVPNISSESSGTLVIADSKEGWADSVKQLLTSLYSGKDLDMDYSLLRQKGMRLKTMGGRSSGPAPLIGLHAFIREMFSKAQGRKLLDIEAHDICNKIAEIVVVGGVRRSSEISLSDLHSESMRTAKVAPFPPHRYMANNSAIYDVKPSAVEFLREWSSLASSGSGERGIFNLSAAKTRAPNRRKAELIQGVNPCKPLNSLILTKNGFITFKQALEIGSESFEIIGSEGQTLLASKPFLTKKNAKVSKVLLSDGTSFYGTPDHKHMDIEGSWISIEDMAAGMRLKRPLVPVYNLESIDETKEDYKSGLLAGWTWGDGWFYPRSDNAGWNYGLCFGNHEFDVVSKFETLFDVKTSPHTQKPDTCVQYTTHNTKYPKKLLSLGYDLDKSNLTWIYGKTPEFKIAFIKAAFTTDGSVRKHNNVELYSTRRNALEVLCNILREFGIASTVCIHNNAKSYTAKDGKIRNNDNCWKLNVYAGQFKKIGFLSEFKNEKLSKQETKPLYRYNGYATVVNVINDHSVEDVYDLNVYDQTHAFLDGGIITHNCGEIMLRHKEFCNLSEVVVRAEDDLDTLLDKVETATWIGVIQSMFTHFPYLSPEWKKNCEEERLLGVSLTGQMDAVELLTPDILKALKKKAIKVAEHASKKMGINMPAAITCVKPSGTVSQLVDSSSGLHTRYSQYYIRRYRISATDPLLRLLADQGVPMTPEVGQEAATANTWVVEFPVKSPDNCITRNDMTAIQQLEHYKKLQQYWCEHNASATIYVKDSEWFEVGNWVYQNWDFINGVSFLPHDGGIYQLAPYEEITKDKYDKLVKKFPKIDYTQLSVYELEDQTQGASALACVSGVCEI